MDTHPLINRRRKDRLPVTDRPSPPVRPADNVPLIRLHLLNQSEPRYLLTILLRAEFALFDACPGIYRRAVTRLGNMKALGDGENEKGGRFGSQITGTSTP